MRLFNCLPVAQRHARFLESAQRGIADRTQRLMDHGKQLTPIPTSVTIIYQDNLSLNSFSKMMVNVGNQIYEKFNMTKSEISRTLSRLESEGMLSRVRDVIGKGVNLKK